MYGSCSLIDVIRVSPSTVSGILLLIQREDTTLEEKRKENQKLGYIGRMKIVGHITLGLRSLPSHYTPRVAREM